MRGKDVKLAFSQKCRKENEKNHLDEIMNKENWDHMPEANVVEEHIEKITWNEKVIAVRTAKPGKEAGPSEVRAELIFAKAAVGSV